MDINNLKDSLTGYRSIVLRLGITPDEKPTKLLERVDEKMKDAVIQWSDSVRHNVERCQISAVALSTTIKEMNTTSLDESYKNIIQQFAPDLKDVSNYVFEINKIFVNSTIDKLLNKMESFYEQFTTKK